jgi:hypothetical protein
MLDAEDYGKYYGVGGCCWKGFGPYIYELMMMLLNIKGKGLMPNRRWYKKDCVKCLV